jgi:hypothetical protein
MFAITCDNASRRVVTCTPDGVIDGPLQVSVLSGDGSVLQDPAEPLTFRAVSGDSVFDAATSDTVGITVFHVEADVRKGPEKVFISEDVVLTVTPVPVPDATTLGFAAGAVEPK